MSEIEKVAALTGLVSILVFIVPISPVKGECNQCENIKFTTHVNEIRKASPKYPASINRSQLLFAAPLPLPHSNSQRNFAQSANPSLSVKSGQTSLSLSLSVHRRLFPKKM